MLIYLFSCVMLLGTVVLCFSRTSVIFFLMVLLQAPSMSSMAVKAKHLASSWISAVTVKLSLRIPLQCSSWSLCIRFLDSTVCICLQFLGCRMSSPLGKMLLHQYLPQVNKNDEYFTKLDLASGIHQIYIPKDISW